MEHRFLYKNVFLIYGHDEKLNAKVRHKLEKNGYKVFVLDERPVVGGESILEAIIKQAKECLTAVAIYSADDTVKEKDVSRSDYKQPRPNVFFELGYLYHCYDLERVLIVKTEDAEICSDLNGVRYIADANLKQLINSLNALTQIEF